MPGPIFRRGEGVTFRPVEEADYEFFQRWLNHPEIRPGFGAATPLAEGDVAERVEGMTESDESETFLVCADNERVGEAFCFDLHEQRGSVETGYWIAPDHQGEGYATAAAELIVDYCVTERRLHKVNARVLLFNDASRAVLESVGFEREGRRRDAFFMGGEYADADLYGMVADEWDGLDTTASAGGDH